MNRVAWAAFALLSVLLAACGADTQKSAAYAGAGLPTVRAPTPSLATNASGGSTPVFPADMALAAPPGGPVPSYDVIAERFNDRPDKASSYYVVIGQVDPGTEAFRDDVKAVLRALARARGGPDFSAHVWDLRSAAQTEVSHKSRPDLFTDDHFQAKEAANDRHYVASYVGGLAFANEPPAYLIMWFPTSSAASPDVGRWIGAETWQPPA